MAVLNLSIVFNAYSSKLSLPSRLRSSFANGLRLGSTSSASVIVPSSFSSARSKRRSSLLLGSASSAAGMSDRLIAASSAARAAGAGGRPVDYSACDCHSKQECAGHEREGSRGPGEKTHHEAVSTNGNSARTCFIAAGPPSTLQRIRPVHKCEIEEKASRARDGSFVAPRSRLSATTRPSIVSARSLKGKRTPRRRSA